MQIKPMGPQDPNESDIDIKKPQKKIEKPPPPPPKKKTETPPEKPRSKPKPKRRRPEPSEDESYYTEESVEVTEDYDDLPSGDIYDGSKGATRKPYGAEAKVTNAFGTSMGETDTSDGIFQGSSTFNKKSVKFE